MEKMQVFVAYPLSMYLQVTAVYSSFLADFQTGYKSIGEAHDFWEMVYVDHGSILTVTDSGSFPIVSSQLYLHKPNQFHQHIAFGRGSSRVFFISFSLTKSDEISSRLEQIFSDGPINTTQEFQEILAQMVHCSEQIFCRLILEPLHLEQVPVENHNPMWDQLLKNNLEILLLKFLLLSNTIQDLTPAPFVLNRKSPEDLCHNAIAFMKDHLMDSISLKDLYEHFGVSKTTMYEAFRSQVGKGPMQYFTILRIERSKELLMNSSANITEIAGMLNFSTPNYFSSVFKKCVGIYPSEFRKGIKTSRSIYTL